MLLPYRAASRIVYLPVTLPWRAPLGTASGSAGQLLRRPPHPLCKLYNRYLGQGEGTSDKFSLQHPGVGRCTRLSTG
jgi:hypothetical protein